MCVCVCAVHLMGGWQIHRVTWSFNHREQLVTVCASERGVAVGWGRGRWVSVSPGSVRVLPVRTATCSFCLNHSSFTLPPPSDVSLRLFVYHPSNCRVSIRCPLPPPPHRKKEQAEKSLAGGGSDRKWSKVIGSETSIKQKKKEQDGRLEHAEM